MAQSCFICRKDLECVSYGSCRHGEDCREVCSTCDARLRFISRHFRCLVCQEEREFVIVRKALVDSTCKPEFPTFLTELEAYQELNEGPIGAFWYNASTKAFFDDFEEYTRINEMCKIRCNSCGEADFKCIGELMIHLYNEHKLYLCTVCLTERQVFICEQKLFSKEELNKHIRPELDEVDEEGHFSCDDCKNPFYSDDGVLIHTSKGLCGCHICDRLVPHAWCRSNAEGHFYTTHIAAGDTYWDNQFSITRAFKNREHFKNHIHFEHVYLNAKYKGHPLASSLNNKSEVEHPFHDSDSPPNPREGKALKEKIWKRFFEGLKDKSRKFCHGLIDGRSYLKHLEGLGLADLVSEVARFCPDSVRKKELIDASLRRENERSSSNGSKMT